MNPGLNATISGVGAPLLAHCGFEPRDCGGQTVFCADALSKFGGPAPECAVLG
jgi:hypothetical protein